MGNSRPALSYLDFIDGLALRGYGARLTPAQRSFASVAFDGALPDGSLESRLLWGDWKLKPPEAARKTVAAVCGRGSGKSLLGGTRLLHLAMTVDVSQLQARERAMCPIIAPSLEQGYIAVRFALGAAETLGLEVTQMKAEGEEGFSITRANGPGGRPVKVRIAALSASARGKAGRGFAIPGAVLDEVAFFRDSSYKVNDKDIYDALKFRVMKGGQIVLLSSPWIESGLLYDLWLRNFGHPEDSLVAHAPTALMRADDPDVLADIELERSVDPEGTRRERDAVFQTANAKAFFDPRAISVALAKKVTFDPQATHSVGGDFAFRRNSTAFAAAQVNHDDNAQLAYALTDLVERRPGASPLKFSEICDEACEFAKRAKADGVVADGHYREAVLERLLNGGVSFIAAPEGAAGKANVFQVARKLLHEELIALGAGDVDQAVLDKLVKQLREVTVRQLAGGGVSIESPLWRTGEHGDLVSAFVLALWRCHQLGFEPLVKKREGYGAPDELEERFMADERRKRERLERLERVTGMELLERRPGEVSFGGTGLSRNFSRRLA